MFESILRAVLIISGIGIVFAIILSIASKIFAVKTDPTVDKLVETLPGANCGACGFSGCEGYAISVSKGESPLTYCTVGGNAVSKELGVIMGIEVDESTRLVARVLCQGNSDVSNRKFDYIGVKTCASVNALYKGDNPCDFGCLGYGDCVEACQFNAIGIHKGVAFIKESQCKSCTLCVAACPRNIIKMTNEKNRVTVLCSNLERGKAVMTVCKNGCIGCTKCVKECPFDAIDMVQGLAVINDKCKNCGKCVKVCPTNAIVQYPKL